MTTAALIDDHPVFRQGLKLLLEAQGGPRVVGEASGAAEAMQVVAATRPDVVVLDLVFPGGESGISIARQLLGQNRMQRILFCTMAKDPSRVADAFEAGALGYVTKDQSAQELLDAVRAVAAGRRYVASALRTEDVEGERRALQERNRQLDLLTPRERQVFDLTIGGLTASAIGAQLSISTRTVETHRARILQKLHARSVLDLVRIAAQHGLLPDERN
jgi:DNA-binding NarL/FixJ family response regulator